MIFGAYDGAVHFVDADTGRRILPDFPTGDLIKGSVTVDPDGYPLVYVGSRDNAYRVIAIDRAVPTELWRLDADAVSPTLWNDDWDGSGLVADGYLFEGGENSQFHAVQLNRSYGADGKVDGGTRRSPSTPPGGTTSCSTPSPTTTCPSRARWRWPGAWPGSPTRAGWCRAGTCPAWPRAAVPERVFRFWMGDDVDATVVVDDEGMLYVAAEWERAHAPVPAGGPDGQARPAAAETPSCGRSPTTRARASRRWPACGPRPPCGRTW